MVELQPQNWSHFNCISIQFIDIYLVLCGHISSFSDLNKLILLRGHFISLRIASVKQYTINVIDIIPHLNNSFLFQCDVTQSLNCNKTLGQTVY